MSAQVISLAAERERRGYRSPVYVPARYRRSRAWWIRELLSFAVICACVGLLILWLPHA